jgi:hypothetical protein
MANCGQVLEVNIILNDMYERFQKEKADGRQTSSNQTL